MDGQNTSSDGGCNMALVVEQLQLCSQPGPDGDAVRDYLEDLNSYVSSDTFIALYETVQQRQQDDDQQERGAFLECTDDTLYGAMELPEPGYKSKIDRYDSDHGSETSWVFVPEKEGLLDDEFILVDNRDVIEAMADFIAKSMAAMPETRSLSARAVQSALLGVFGDIRYCGAIGSVWGWEPFYIRLIPGPHMPLGYIVNLYSLLCSNLSWQSQNGAGDNLWAIHRVLFHPYH